MVERTAHNGLVVGSSPTKPKNLSLYKMDHNLKKYRVLKVKNNFKNSDLLFFYHSSKIKSNKWMLTEQHLKKIKLEYNQIYNGTAIKTINKSIYLNIKQIISGVIIFAKPIFKLTTLKLKTVKNDLSPSFILLFLKLNNKIYILPQFNNINTFNYKTTVFNLNRNLNRYTKTVYRLKNQSK